MCVDLICLRGERTLSCYGVVDHEHWEKGKGNGLLESGYLLHSYQMREIYIYNAYIARPLVERTAQDSRRAWIAHVMHGRTWQVSFA